MRVDIIAATKVFDDRIEEALGRTFPRDPAAADGEHLVETAGRLCYMSFQRPNPGTAANSDYIRHILEVRHGSVLEHGVVTFLFQQVSRSLTLELIRHRHFSYSQLSQRYVPERDAAMVVPEVIADDPQLSYVFDAGAKVAQQTYNDLLAGLERKFADEPNATLRRKKARQAARAILPNATETRIVVTGNYRAWRHFLAMRATEHADVEIRELAVECLRQLQVEVPNVFRDFVISRLEDGSEVASSPFAVDPA